MKTTDSGSGKLLRNLLFFSTLLLALLISMWARAEQVTLAWDANTESDLAGYKIHYGTAGGSYSVHIDVHNVTTFTVTGLTAGQTYYFAATAYNASGSESGYSNQVSYAVPSPNGAPTTPATPTGASSATVNTALTFSTTATDPNGDSLQYRFDWGGGVLSNWGAASQARGWAAAGQYAVKAQARDSLGAESGWSGAKTVTITAPAPVVVDTDGDGVPDSQDAFPNDPAEWADANGNGIGDNADAVQNHSPAAPQVIAPAANAITPLTPTLQTGAFSDPDAGDSHTRTRWQIVQASNSLVVLDVTSSAELTALQVPSLLLDENTEYHCRAMFYDNHGAASEWSPQVRFATDFSLTDANGNGIPDSQEVDPATNPDGSGVSGSQDGSVKTVRTGKSGAKVGIGTAPASGAAIYSIESTDPDVVEIDVDADGISDALPFGLLNFKLVLDHPGDQAVVKVYFSEPMPKRGRWYKYDPIQKRWSDFSRYAQFSDDRMSMTLTITDGGEGDADGVANGIILDPAGVLVASSSGSDSIIDGVVGGVGGVVDSAQGGCFIAASAPGRSTGGESFYGWSAILALTLAGFWLRKAFQAGY